MQPFQELAEMSRAEKVDLLARFNRYTEGDTFAVTVRDVSLLRAFVDEILPDPEPTVIVTGWDSIVNAYREAKEAERA